MRKRKLTLKCGIQAVLGLQHQQVLDVFVEHAERDTRGLFSEADLRIVKVITFLGGL